MMSLVLVAALLPLIISLLDKANGSQEPVRVMGTAAGRLRILQPL
jgi:hypothetical protein